MALQTITTGAIATVLGETLEQYAVALVRADQTVWPADGYTLHATVRRSFRQLADWTVDAGTLALDRTTGLVTFRATADELVALGAGAADLWLGAVAHDGTAHDLLHLTWTIAGAGAALAGADRPAASPQQTFTVTVALAVDQILLRGDFTGLPAGALAVASLPAASHYLRYGDAYLIQDDEDVLVAVADGDHVPTIGRFRAADARGLYIGAACTDLLNSHALTGTDWTGVGTFGPGPTGPDGQPSVRVQTPSGTISGRTFLHRDTWTGLTYTASAWLASGDGTARTTQLAEGVATNTAITCATTARFKRFVVTRVESSNQENIYFASGSDFSTVGGVVAGDRDDAISQPQMVLGGFPSMPVRVGATRGGVEFWLDPARALDTTGRLTLEFEATMECARRDLPALECKFARVGDNVVKINRDTGIVTFVVNGATNASTRALSWERGDRLRLVLESGGGTLASQARYQINRSGVPGDLAVTGAPLGSWAGAARLDVMSGGASEQTPGFLQAYSLHRSGHEPDWVAGAAWLPDFRATVNGIRNSRGIAVDRHYFVQPTIESRVVCRYDGGYLDLLIWSDQTAFPGQAVITVEVPGLGYTVAQATVFNTPTLVRVPVLGSGPRDVYLTNGMPSRVTPPQNDRATWLIAAFSVDGTSLVVQPRTVTPASGVVGLGDSILCGQGLNSTPQQDSFVGLMRTRRGFEISLIGAGGHALYYYKDDLAGLAAKMAGLAGEYSTRVVVWWELGTNDQFLALWDGPAGGVTGYQNTMLAAINAVYAAIVATGLQVRFLFQTRFGRTLGSPNSLGQTIAQFDAADAAAIAASNAAAVSTIMSGPTALPVSGLSDGIHGSRDSYSAGEPYIAGQIQALL